MSINPFEMTPEELSAYWQGRYDAEREARTRAFAALRAAVALSRLYDRHDSEMPLPKDARPYATGSYAIELAARNALRASRTDPDPA